MLETKLALPAARPGLRVYCFVDSGKKMTIETAALVQFLEKELGLSSGDFDEETLLFSDGVLDSISLTDLILFIEENAGIRIAPTEVNLDNLDSIARIRQFVAGKLA